MSEMIRFMRFLIENDNYDQTISNYAINLHKWSDDGNLFSNMYKNQIYPLLIETIQNKTHFKDVQPLLENSRICNIMYNGIGRTNLLMNPLYSVRGNKKNDMFKLTVETPENPHSHAHVTYLSTQKSNLLSYYTTIQGKEFFAYIALEAKLNSIKTKSISNSSYKEYIDIVREVSDPNKPWIIKTIINDFKIVFRDDMAICGGIAGVPNSIYISMVDRSWIFLFSRGTCLIITGKQNVDPGLTDNLSEIQINRKSFLLTFINNINTILTIVINLINSETFVQRTNEFFNIKCSHAKNDSLFCSLCTTKATSDINMFDKSIKHDRDELEKIKHDLYVNKISNHETIDLFEKMSMQKYSILSLISFGVAGMRYRGQLNGIVTNEFTDEEKVHINMFSGDKLIFKSIKSVDDLKYYEDIFFSKQNKLSLLKEEIKRKNVFDMNIQELETHLRQVKFLSNSN
jgi:hypothetical protein